MDGEWLVVSFSVQRGDEEREPKPSASGSPGASGSAEPSEAEGIVRRRATYLLVALVAWVLGSSLGALSGTVRLGHSRPAS